MNFCVNCKFYQAREEYKRTRHDCMREQSSHYNLVTGEPLVGYVRDAENERTGEESAGYCGASGVYFRTKITPPPTTENVKKNW